MDKKVSFDVFKFYFGDTYINSCIKVSDNEYLFSYKRQDISEFKHITDGGAGCCLINVETKDIRPFVYIDFIRGMHDGIYFKQKIKLPNYVNTSIDLIQYDIIIIKNEDEYYVTRKIKESRLYLDDKFRFKNRCLILSNIKDARLAAIKWKELLEYASPNCDIIEIDYLEFEQQFRNYEITKYYDLDSENAIFEIIELVDK